jgi:hypothetical protein
MRFMMKLRAEEDLEILTVTQFKKYYHPLYFPKH